ncbi:hypothetical protein EDC05_005530 [Coemansia umbellata]|uniref:DNA mismatch repair proteins mutS family domain-containing protein n=1 Tax=Coemansia umbellata TaxID=1424467 RepID=A0ABQ8PFB3_9FUNG|nr:hypothetical protein EDC05_005530 [Coemansia umbellata]
MFRPEGSFMNTIGVQGNSRLRVALNIVLSITATRTFEHTEFSVSGINYGGCLELHTLARIHTQHNSKKIAFEAGHDSILVFAAIYRLCVPNIDVLNIGTYEDANLVWIEVPLNSTSKIKGISKYAQRANETVALLGADVMIHWATKHLAGHCDLFASVVATRSAILAKELRETFHCFGFNISNHEAWLPLRFLCTLRLRIEQQTKPAVPLILFLDELHQNTHCEGSSAYLAHCISVVKNATL